MANVPHHAARIVVLRSTDLLPVAIRLSLFRIPELIEQYPLVQQQDRDLIDDRINNRAIFTDQSAIDRSANRIPGAILEPPIGDRPIHLVHERLIGERKGRSILRTANHRQEIAAKH
jgi:hypothetical protein